MDTQIALFPEADIAAAMAQSRWYDPRAKFTISRTGLKRGLSKDQTIAINKWSGHELWTPKDSVLSRIMNGRRYD